MTDRYSKAIEQLGSNKLDVCIGGIYALERVARDSAKDHPTVMEVLTAFIRDHSHEPWPPPDHPADQEQERSTRPDVQAAVTVVGRRNIKRDIQQRDMPRIDLARADLTRAYLNDAYLNDASLTENLREKPPALAVGMNCPVLRHPARPGHQRREEHSCGRSCRRHRERCRCLWS